MPNYQRIPILGVHAITKSVVKAVPFLLYLKIRAELAEKKGGYGEFWISEEYAAKFGMNLRGLKASLKKGIKYGWFRKCEHHANRYEIVALLDFTHETASDGITPLSFATTGYLYTDFLNTITWRNISELRRYIAEMATDLNLRTTIAYEAYHAKQDEIKDMMTSGPGYSKKRKNKSSVHTKRTEAFYSNSFQGGILGLSKSTIHRYRQTGEHNPLPFDVSYSYKQDIISTFGQKDHYLWDDERIAYMNQIQTEAKLDVTQQGRYFIAYDGTIKFNHVSVRKSNGILDIKRVRINSKYIKKL